MIAAAASLLAPLALLLLPGPATAAYQVAARASGPAGPLGPIAPPAVESFSPGVPFSTSGPVLEAGPVVVFSVSEAVVGASLNGDADLDDDVVHVFDARTGRLSNLGWVEPTSGTFFRWAGADVCAFIVREADHGVDLDGNGFQTDWVTQFWLPASDTVVNSGFRTTSDTVSDGIESTGNFVEGSVFPLLDFGGDLFVFDAATSLLSPVVDGFTFEAAGDLLYHNALDGFRVLEPSSGTSTLLAGPVVWSYRASEKLVVSWSRGAPDGAGGWIHPITILDRVSGASGSTGLSGPPTSSLEASARVVDGAALFLAFEPHSGLDLNGDGDQEDTLLHVYDAATSAVRNTGVEQPFFQARGDVWRRQVIVSTSPLVLFDLDTLTLLDTGHGAAATDSATTRGHVLLASSSAVEVYDIDTGQLADLGLRITGLRDPLAGRNFFAIPVDEGLMAQDLNGDDDTGDTVIFLHELRNGRTTNTRLAGSLVRHADTTGDDRLSPWLTIRTDANEIVVLRVP